MRRIHLKSTLLKAAVLLVAAFSALSLFGCKTEIEKYDRNISELRTNVYAAESSAMRVTAITGRREIPFVLDGHSDEKQDFTVITVVPTPFTAGKTYRYKAAIGGKEYEGEFLPHPFAESLSCDIPVKCTDAEIALTISSGEAGETLALKSQITAETITAEKALEIGMNKLSDRVAEMKSGGKLNAEIFVRLTENPIDSTGGYFWYVAFVDENQETYAVLLNSTTGEVCAIRN